MTDQYSSEELLEIASKLFNALNELQGELYDELKVINKELEWSTFYPYGASGIKLNYTWFADTICDCDKSRQPNKNKIGGMTADPRNDDDYFTFIGRYNLQPEYYVVVADEMTDGSIALNTYHISEILEYIIVNAELDGTVNNKLDDITKYERQKKIGYYVGAINYLGKVNLLYNYYFENYYEDFGSPKKMFTNLFGSQLTNGNGIYEEIAKEQTGLLKTALSDVTSSDIKRNCGIFIKEASFCPQDLVNEKIKIVEKYEEVYLAIIDILKNVDSLQFCAAEASAEDVLVAKNGNCNIEFAVESIVNCLGQTINDMEELQPSSQKTTDTTNYGPKEREDKTHDVEEDDKYKKVITALLVIILIFLFVGIGFGSYFIYTKTSGAKNNNYYDNPYNNSYSTPYNNSYSNSYINNPMVQQTS